MQFHFHTFIQGRSHTFEHDDLEVSQSPSHVPMMGLPPYAIHDGSMSSSQSVSSSNSGSEAEVQEDTEPALEGASAGKASHNVGARLTCDCMLVACMSYGMSCDYQCTVVCMSCDYLCIVALCLVTIYQYVIACMSCGIVTCISYDCHQLCACQLSSCMYVIHFVLQYVTCI